MNLGLLFRDFLLVLSLWNRAIATAITNDILDTTKEGRVAV